jgi:hypothetical protein
MNVEQNRLSFTTSSFSVEKSSVLHKGVYSKEFSATLFASAICIVVYMAVSFTTDAIVFIRTLILIFTFVASFLLSRTYLFRENFLKLVLDKSSKTASITRSGLLGRKTEKIALERITSVETGIKSYTPENIDGIHFVQKISLQHGSAMPGLGDKEEFITLSLKLSDGSERIIYAGNIEKEPELPVQEIVHFLEK